MGALCLLTDPMFISLPALYFLSPLATSCCPKSLKPNTWTSWMLSTDWEALAHPVHLSLRVLLAWLCLLVGRCGCLGVPRCAAPLPAVPTGPGHLCPVGVLWCVPALPTAFCFG